MNGHEQFSSEEDTLQAENISAIEENAEKTTRSESTTSAKEEKNTPETKEEKDIAVLDRKIEKEASEIEALTVPTLEDKAVRGEGPISRFFDRAEEIREKAKRIIKEKEEKIYIASRERELRKIYTKKRLEKDKDGDDTYQRVEAIYQTISEEKIETGVNSHTAEIGKKFAEKALKEGDIPRALRWDRFISLENQYSFNDEYKRYSSLIREHIATQNPNASGADLLKKMSETCKEHPRLLMDFLCENARYNSGLSYSEKEHLYGKIREVAEQNPNNTHILNNIPEKLFTKNNLFSHEVKRHYLLNCGVPKENGFAFTELFPSLSKEERKSIIEKSLKTGYGDEERVNKLERIMQFIPLQKDEFSDAIGFIKLREKNTHESLDITAIEERIDTSVAKRIKENPLIQLTNGHLIDPPESTAHILDKLFPAQNSSHSLETSMLALKLIIENGDRLGVDKNDARERFVSNTIKNLETGIPNPGFVLGTLYKNETLLSEDRMQLFEKIINAPKLQKWIMQEAESNSFSTYESDKAKKSYEESKESGDKNVRDMAEQLFFLHGNANELRHYLTDAIQGGEGHNNMDVLIKYYVKKESGERLGNEFTEMFLDRDILDVRYAESFLEKIDSIEKEKLNGLSQRNPEKYQKMLQLTEAHGNGVLLLSLMERGTLANPNENTVRRTIHSFKEQIGEEKSSRCYDALKAGGVTDEKILEIALNEGYTRMIDTVFGRVGIEFYETHVGGLIQKCRELSNIENNLYFLRAVDTNKELYDPDGSFMNDTLQLIREAHNPILNIKLLEMDLTTKPPDSFLKETVDLVSSLEHPHDKEAFLIFYKQRMGYEQDERLKAPDIREGIRKIYKDIVQNIPSDDLSGYLSLGFDLYEEKLPQDIFDKLFVSALTNNTGREMCKYESQAEAYLTKRYAEAKSAFQQMREEKEKENDSYRFNQKKMGGFMKDFTQLDLPWVKKHIGLDKETVLQIISEISTDSEAEELHRILEQKFIPWLTGDKDIAKETMGNVLGNLHFPDETKYIAQKGLSNTTESIRLFQYLGGYKDSRLRSIAAGELIASWFSSKENIEQLIVASSQNAQVAITTIEKYVETHKTSMSNFGITITALLGIREFQKDQSQDSFLISVADSLKRYGKTIDAWSVDKIPESIRATIGMEYEMTNSLRETYKNATQRSIERDMNEVNDFAGIGRGRDGVYEIATPVADNPYLMLLEMQLLEDINFIDLNFKKEGYEKAARGMHLTVGGERGKEGIKKSKNINFLHNTLIASGWGGINAGHEIRGVTHGRAYPLRERSSFSDAHAVEMRSLSIDKWEPFERTTTTAYLGAIAIQAMEQYTTLDPESIDIASFPETEEAFLEYLTKNNALKKEPNNPKILSAIYAWCGLSCEVREALELHNKSFLENETVGYINEKGVWIDVKDFGGKENMERFKSITEKLGSSPTAYAEKLTMEPEKFFKEVDPEFINVCTAIANLFLKPTEELGGDKVNAAAVLATTKIDGKMEDDSFENAEKSSFEQKRMSRKGYYSLQGGSKRMLIHAIQQALLSFHSRMETSFELT